ncbi:MAG: hypothetical protein KGZ61_12215 [Sandarakinorhabdus sp.]|nr:hypothetical protein [Sandarakinorhabdus sp.]
MADTRIMLASGSLFDLANPEGSELSLYDIAYGLGRVCRFAGHTGRFYSVAEHCTHVARLVPVRQARAALLHDASEAIIGDVTRPLKAMLPEYRVIEARLDDFIAARFAPDGAQPLDLHAAAIKAADRAMCAVEARELMPHAPGYWEGIGADPADMKRARSIRLQCDKPEFATMAWLRAWHWYGHAEDEAAAQAVPPQAVAG